MHYEPRWFKPWPASVRANYEFEDKEYPVGDLIFDCGGVRIGFEICEDAWVADRPGGALARRGVDVILNGNSNRLNPYVTIVVVCVCLPLLLPYNT